MKLRILDNAIRLRLSQTEVGHLRDTGEVRSTINFPGGVTLAYRVLHHANVFTIAVDFTDRQITLRLPSERAIAWADSGTVSIRAENDLTDGGTLKILLEKDFKCLTTRAHEDESDLFPHPKEGEMEC